MKILINGNEYELKDLNKFGGEADLYAVEYEGEEKCVKIYYPEKRTAYNERKALTLINKFDQVSLGGIEESIAYPEIPVYDLLDNKFLGFMMKYYPYPKYIPLFELKFSNNTLTYGETMLNDLNVFKLFDRLFLYCRILHKAGIILGDINPENILVDSVTGTPVLVDFDSVQIGSFYCNTRRNDYVDPTVKVDGHGRYKYFIYSTNSDIFTLSLIFYETVVGSKPHFFQTTEPAETNYKKSIGLSFFDYFTNNENKIVRHSLQLEKNKTYDALMERLRYLEVNHPRTFSFLKSILVQNKRYYYFFGQLAKVHIGRKNGRLEFKEVELLSQSKEDPDELRLFIEQFNLNL